MKNILKLLAVLILVMGTNKSFSQGQSWNWYFGFGAGVNFPGAGPPVAMINGMANTLEGVATISDAAGNLLFYTDGSTVWNKLHLVMTNGTGLMGNGSSTQSGVIIPKPGSPNIYYIFTCNTFGGGYRYSEVDMTLSAGNGAVTANKNIMVNMNNTEKCCAVKHCNGVDYWIITHEGNNSTWKTYLVTAAGINLVPVVSAGVGSNNVSPGIGYLKSSTDGKKLAYAVYINGFLEILDFNNSTGVVSNPITITGAQYSNEYGVEFSPDNTKVYFGSYATMKITQVNLCAGSNAAIIASATDIGTATNAVGALQLGPDGKIWVSRSGAPWLGVINSPNTLGAGCNFVNNGVSLNGKNAGAGLPNFISSIFQPTLAPITSTVVCLNASFTSPTLNTTQCAAASNAITSYSWNFGDPGSGPLNTSALANPTHAYPTAGTYTVNLILTIPCGTIGLTHTLTTISCSPQVIVNSATICSQNCAVLTATASGGTGPYTYAWSPNIGNTAGPFTVCPSTTTIYTVSITDALNVTVSNTSTVLVNPTPTMVITPSSSTLCMNNYNGSSNTISINATGATTYSWTGISGITTSGTTGSNITATAVPASAYGTASVIGTIGTCTSVTSFTVVNIPNPVIAVTSSSMCYGTSATLTASGASNYAWSPISSLNPSTGSMVIGTPTTTTIYSVIGTSLNCNSTTETGSIVVVANPTVFITSGSPTICAGSSLGLTANGAVSYTWSPSNTLDNSNTANVIATPLSTTNYILIGSANTCTGIAMKQVVVIPLPTLQAVCENSVFCEGGRTSINANGATSYSWTPTYGIDNPSANNITVNPSISTVYTLLGNNGICTATLQVPVVVVPSPNLNLSTPNQKICDGTNTTIFASGAQNYNWVPNTNINLTTPNTAVVSPLATTNYSVTGYNSSGTVMCSVTKEIEITVVPQVTATVGSSVAICAGDAVKLNAGGGNMFLWTPSEGLNNVGIAQPNASPLISTVYSVQVSHDGNCGSTATVLVKINPKAEVNAGEDLVFNLDELMYINAIGTGTLTWLSGEGVYCASCPSTQIMPKNSSCYVVQSINSYGCKAKDEVCVEVTKDHNIYIPNIFTPNFDGINDVFLVYGTGLTKLEMTIFDRWGEKLFFSNDQLKGWDGTYKGKESKQDVYTYLINYTSLDGKKHTKTGHVSLLK